MTGPVPRATLVAFLLPLIALAGAWGSQLIGGLYPCEMCHWQRWPHYAALAVATLALVAPPRARRALTLVAALLVAVSGVIGVTHAGVEYHWWRGFTGCTQTLALTGTTAAERFDQLMAAPLVRCDVPQWTLGGVSLAGFNAIWSLGGAALVAAMTLARRVR